MNRSVKYNIIHSVRMAIISLALLLIVSLAFHATAYATSGTCGEGLTWTLSGSRLTISGEGAMDNYEDESMQPWYDSRNDIVSVTVGDGVTRIGRLAFFGLENMTRANLSDTVKIIGERAFKNCGSLIYVNMSAGLEVIGDSAFENCSSLSAVRLQTGLGKIGDFAFFRCSSLTSVNVPNTVYNFGSAVFAYCTGLIDAKILCPVSTMPDWTFFGCTALSNLTLSETVETIGTSGFYQCNNLNSIFYNGSAKETIVTEIKDNSENNNAIRITVMEMEEPSSAFVSQSTDENGIHHSEMISVTSTDDSNITVTTNYTHSFTIDGNPATTEEVLSIVETAAENNESPIVKQNTYGAVTTGIGISQETDTKIEAIIENENGWKEIEKTVKTVIESQTKQPAVSQDETEKMSVVVQILDTKITSDDLKITASKDLELSITAADGTTWIIDQSSAKSQDYRQETYDLGITVSKAENAGNNSAVTGETIYNVKFNSDIDFTATVGVPLKVSEARKTATLYEKHGNEYNAVQNVVVDDSGTAWFQLASTDEKTDYFVAVNAAGVDHSEAIVPTTLSKDYNINSTLVGADGKQYEITGRTSRWGITGAEFAIYVAIAVGFVVLLITLIMVTMNRISKSRAKMIAEAEAKESSKDLDEEELRLEIMRELLEEQEKTNKQ